MMSRISKSFLFITVMATFSGCSLAPAGLAGEEERVRVEGEKYELSFERRDLPELSSEPDWKEILRRAFLANRELESAYYNWKAAVERVGIASSYPNANLSLGYSYAFSAGKMKAFDRQSFSGGTDPMENLSLPSKVAQAGVVALDQARIAGEQFRVKKFELQREILTQWAEYCFLAEKERIEQNNLLLLKLAKHSAEGRVQAGGPQSELLKAEILRQTAENNLKNTFSELSRKKNILNGILLREPTAALSPPNALPLWRPIPQTDDILLEVATEKNPELASLAVEVQGRSDALELARLQWLPDINPSILVTGSVTQAFGAAIILPTTVNEIKGRIKEAKSILQASEAMLYQTRADRGARFIATLVALRNSERESYFLKTVISPAAERLLENARQEYATNTVPFIDYIESYRMFLDSKLALARAHTDREKFLAEIEALSGVDIETITASKKGS